MSGYRGRFAPSPTGPLHFGSLVSAMTSYLQARVHQGVWLLRIDDIDQTRCIPGMDSQIMQTLEAFGFAWDEPVQYQTRHQAAYQDALHQLDAKEQLYACHCSRKSWQAQAHMGVDGLVYPGICRTAGLPDKQGHALRIRTSNQPISVSDGLHGPVGQSLETDVGDFIVRRVDGYVAYQLAVVVDDQLAGINHVVRGADLLLSTPRQVYLQQQLGYATPQYLHTPLVLQPDGKKLSKSDAAHPLDPQYPVSTLNRAWRFLRQVDAPDVDRVEDFWQWAEKWWDVGRLMRFQLIT